MSRFNKVFFIELVPLVFIWMIITGDHKEMPLLLNDIYKDIKNK